jgi:site-specific recombinase XerD
MDESLSSSVSLATSTLMQLETWVAAAREAFSGETLRAYAADSRIFAIWCDREGISALPATPESVAKFLRAEAAEGRAVATVRRRAATISRLHRAAGIESPCDHEFVRLALKGIARARGTDQRQAAGLTERDADLIEAQLGNTLRHTRDLALLLVGRDLLARASELVALAVENLEPTDDGMLVELRRGKTMTETRSYFIGPEATAALNTWLTRAKITQGPVFQSLTKGHRPTGRALGTRDVRRILKALAAGAQLGHVSTVSGHSLRVGMAQDLAAANISAASIAQAGGWGSLSSVLRYTRALAARRGAVARFYSLRCGRPDLPQGESLPTGIHGRTD